MNLFIVLSQAKHSSDFLSHKRINPDCSAKCQSLQELISGRPTISSLFSLLFTLLQLYRPWSNFLTCAVRFCLRTFSIPLYFVVNLLFLYCHMTSTPHFIQFSVQMSSYVTDHPKTSNPSTLPYQLFLLTHTTIIFNIYFFPSRLLSFTRMSVERIKCFSCLILNISNFLNVNFH